MEKRELTKSQKAAVRLMREKVNGAVAEAQRLQADYRQLVIDVADEVGIEKDDLGKWRFDEVEMSFAPKPEAADPKLTIPKKG